MANEVVVWNYTFRTSVAPASGGLYVGNGAGLDLVPAQASFAGGLLVFGVSIKTTSANGYYFSDGTNQTTAATAAASTVTLSGAQTLTNKRITPRIVSVASGSTITPTGDTADQYEVTALAAAATIAAPSGTPTDGQKLILRIKDNGTARALTWTTTSGAYRAVGISLPTTTVLSKVVYVGFIYNSQDTFWDAVATVQQ